MVLLIFIIDVKKCSFVLKIVGVVKFGTLNVPNLTTPSTPPSPELPA